MKAILSLLVLFMSAQLASAQMDVVTWTYESKKVNDQEYDLVFKAFVKDGWYIYSQYLENDGPIPTSVNYSDTEGYELVEKAREEGKKIEGYDKIFMMDITKYKGELIITQRIKSSTPPEEIKGFIEFMSCNDDQCLPPKEVAFTILF